MLRNSVEIFQFNRSIAAHVRNAQSFSELLPLPQPGTNFHGPLTCVYELFDDATLIDRTTFPQDAPETQIMAEFVIHVYHEILRNDSKSRSVPILVEE